MKVKIIHVCLPEEATDCYFPVSAEQFGNSDIYRILDEAPEDPVWEFGKDDIVRCHPKRLQGGFEPFREESVAFEKVSNKDLYDLFGTRYKQG